jgi:hypothetical protein
MALRQRRLLESTRPAIGMPFHMPQCQRSPNNTVLPDADFEIAPGVVSCPGAPFSPGCGGRELYIRLLAGPLVDYLQGSVASCASRFEVAIDTMPVDLWLGEGPLTVLEDTGRWAIYLARGSDPWQFRRQIAHESFHRVCSPAGRGSWVHEMLAEVFTMRRLHEAGDEIYANPAEAAARDTAGTTSLAELHAWTGEPGLLYNKALAVGQELLESCGWKYVAVLAGYFNHQWNPDPARWLASIPTDLQEPAGRILGI